MGKIVTLGEAAEITGKSIAGLRIWIRNGMPVVARGDRVTPWRIDIAEVIRWREEQAAANAVGDTSDADIDELKRRKLAAEAAMAEIDLALRRGDALAAADVGKAWADMVAAFRAKVLGIPAKLAPALVAETDLILTRSMLEDVLHEALRELADDDLRDDKRGQDEPAGDSAADASDGKAASPPHRKRVG